MVIDGPILPGAERVLNYAPLPADYAGKKERPNFPTRRGERKAKSAERRASAKATRDSEVARGRQTESPFAGQTIYVSSITEGHEVYSRTVNVSEQSNNWDRLEVNYAIAQGEKGEFDLATHDGVVAFGEAVGGMSKTDREGLGDLRKWACEKVGLGPQKDVVAEAGATEALKECLHDLQKVVATKSLEPDEITSLVEKSLSEYRGLLMERGIDFDGSKPLQAGSLALIIANVAATAAEAGKKWNRKKLSNSLIVLSIFALVLANCSTGPETRVAQAKDIPPNKESFGGSNLQDEIVDVLATVSNMDVLKEEADLALQQTGLIKGRTYAIVGQTLVDSDGNKQPLVMALLFDGNGQKPTPIPEDKYNLAGDPNVFLYAEGDGLIKLVPPGAGVDEAGGKMIPLRFWKDESTGEIQLGVEGYDNLVLWKIYAINGELKAIFRDPFSGLEYKSSVNDSPIVGDHIASLDPLFGLNDVMENDAVIDNQAKLDEVLKKLQDKGVNVEHRVDNADGGWGLIVNGENVPNAFINEEGDTLFITDREGEQVQIGIEDTPDRLDVNEDGLLTLDNGHGVKVGMFDPQNTEAGWMFFDYNKPALESLTEFNLDRVSEISLDVDANGHVHLPEEILMFENLNAKPFPGEAVYMDLEYFDFPESGRKDLDLGASPESPERIMFELGDFASNPQLRPVKAEFIFRLDENAAFIMGIGNEELFIVGVNFLNDPNKVGGDVAPNQIVNLAIPGPVLRELVLKGYFKNGGYFMPAFANGFLDKEFGGKFKVLLKGGLFEKQGLKQRDMEALLQAVGNQDFFNKEIGKFIFPGAYSAKPWKGQWFDLKDL